MTVPAVRVQTASMRVVLVDDLRSFRDGRACEVARDSVTALRLLSEGGARIDELWLDHDLGEGDTIRPVLLELERAAAEGARPDIGVVCVHSANPPAAETIVRSLTRCGYQVRPVHPATDLLSAAWS